MKPIDAIGFCVAHKSRRIQRVGETFKNVLNAALSDADRLIKVLKEHQVVTVQAYVAGRLNLELAKLVAKKFEGPEEARDACMAALERVLDECKEKNVPDEQIEAMRTGYAATLNIVEMVTE